MKVSTVSVCLLHLSDVDLQGVPKKIQFKPIFEFLGGVFLEVKNYSKNFGNQKKLGCLAKF